jgi:anti-anti-sigma factor
MADAPFEPFRIEVEAAGAARRVVLRGEFDLAAAEEAGDALGAACEAAGRVEIDLGQVSFMDSSGLRTLVTARRRAERHGCAVVVTAMSEQVRQVLQLTGTFDWLASDGD